MMLSIRTFLTFVVLIFVCENLYSQQLPEKIKTYRIGHLSYITHDIEKNETLGKIAAKYQVTVKEILDLNTIDNPEKIVEGQSITVPDYSSFINQYPRDKWTYELYKVVKGDKLKSLAKKYNISQDDIKNVNWRLEKLNEGYTVRIPVPKFDVLAQKPEKEKDKDKKDKQDNKGKNPALSFNWGNNQNEDDDKPADYQNILSDYRDCSKFVFESGMEFTLSLVVRLTKEDKTAEPSGLAFLQGALLALNDMKNSGLHIKFKIFDIGQANRIDKLLQSQDLKESSLIVASAPFADVKKLAGFAKENKINLVIPSEDRAGALVESNPYVIHLSPSDNAVYQKITGKKYESNNLFPVLIVPAKPDSLMLDFYKAALKKRFGTFVEHKHVMGLSLNNLPFKNILNKDKQNLIFVCSNAEEPFVSDLLTRLNTLKGYPISVYGKDKWNDFKLINRKLFFDINLHLPQSLFIDYKNEEVKEFVRSFRGAYNNEPDKSAFLGHDIVSYFLTALKKYGPTFQDCFIDFQATMLQSQFKFNRNKPGDGFVNDGCFLLEYTQDLVIKRE